jgi:hypothetical protein
MIRYDLHPILAWSEKAEDQDCLILGYISNPKFYYVCSAKIGDKQFSTLKEALLFFASQLPDKEE